MYVRLRSTDLDTIIEILQEVVNYKFQVLRPQAWYLFEHKYLPSCLDQIQANQFLVRNRTSNTFLWLIDQICWSRQLTPGVSPELGIPLIDTERGQRAAQICRLASQGQLAYDSRSQLSQYTNLFEAED